MASNLLTKEVKRKNVENSRVGNALLVGGRSTNKGKSQERAKSKSNSCHNLEDMKCYNCGKKGQLKKNYRSKKKDKKQDKGKKKQKETNLKIEEICIE